MFRLICGFTLVLFFSTMIFVTFAAYNRSSGSLRMDLSKIDVLRKP